MNTFKKEERLCSRKMIDQLYSEGKSFICYPLRISYYSNQLISNSPAQVVFVASKKRFKKAVKRNLIKRRMREAYRLNKENLYELLKLNNQTIIFSVAYIGKEIEKFAQIELQMKNMIKKFSSILPNGNL